MISNSDSKFIKSLQLKKFRTLEKLFVVEGAKNVLELLNSDLVIRDLYVTDSFSEKYHVELNDTLYQLAKQKELEKIGSFTTNDSALAVVEIPNWSPPDFDNGLTLAFDRINDPGNLGTIMRIADWYDIPEIICSPGSVDCFNPKAIGASMGAFTRIKVFYEPISPILEKVSVSFGTALDGVSIHEVEVEKPAVILFGSESHGLDEELLSSVTKKVTIPGYGLAESLNVAISAAIVCDNFTRKLNLDE